MQLTKEQRQTIQQLADSYGLTNIRVFGSHARNEATEDSDLDLLVDWGQARLMQLGGFKYDLEEQFGHRVDVIPSDSINPLIAKQILREARPL